MAININGVGSNPAPRVGGSDQSAAKTSNIKPEEAKVNSAAAGRVELSAHAQNLYKNELGSFDEERVEAIKKQFADGRYQVDYNQLAGKLISFESGL